MFGSLAYRTCIYTLLHLCMRRHLQSTLNLESWKIVVRIYCLVKDTRRVNHKRPSGPNYWKKWHSHEILFDSTISTAVVIMFSPDPHFLLFLLKLLFVVFFHDILLGTCFVLKCRRKVSARLVVGSFVITASSWDKGRKCRRWTRPHHYRHPGAPCYFCLFIFAKRQMKYAWIIALNESKPSWVFKLRLSTGWCGNVHGSHSEQSYVYRLHGEIWIVKY